jgi:Ca2+/Na+ antiporter
MILDFLLSFYLLAKVIGSYFVDSLDKIAAKLKMSSDAAGATLMAAGSSAPELFIALFAVFRPGNHEAIGIGNIVGSAIFNILAITGAAAVVRKALIAWQAVIRDLVFYAVAVLLLIIMFKDGKVEWTDAVLFIGIYLIYIFVVVFWRKMFNYVDPNEEKQEIKKKIDKSEFVVTVLAAGTSVPDFISSVVVSKQGRGGMAISNVIGSNIFDILIGLGLPFLLMILITGGNISLHVDNLDMSVRFLFASVVVLLGLFMINKWVVGKKMGAFLILLYEKETMQKLTNFVNRFF